MNTETKKCPLCAEQIPQAAVTCEYCGARFEVTGSGYCQNCHEVREADGNGQCSVCGSAYTVTDNADKLLYDFGSNLPTCVDAVFGGNGNIINYTVSYFGGSGHKKSFRGLIAGLITGAMVLSACGAQPNGGQPSSSGQQPSQPTNPPPTAQDAATSQVVRDAGNYVAACASTGGVDFGGCHISSSEFSNSIPGGDFSNMSVGAGNSSTLNIGGMSIPVTQYQVSLYGQPALNVSVFADKIDGNTYAAWTPVPASQLPTAVPPTATSIPVHAVTVQAFHDYNGNGMMDAGEPVLGGIVNKTSGGSKCTTGVDGTCTLKGVPEGSLVINVDDNRYVQPYEKMRFLFPSVSGVFPISQDIEVKPAGGSVLYIPLGQGFLSYYFYSNIAHRVHAFVDVDPMMCRAGSDPYQCPNILDWMGGQKTYDDHTGTDARASIGTPILSASPGIVSETGFSKSRGNYVFVQILDYTVCYHHLDTISVSRDALVNRGQLIGTVGNTGNSGMPHLHIEVKKGQKNPEFIDPYHNLADQDSPGLWIVVNEPIMSAYPLPK